MLHSAITISCCTNNSHFSGYLSISSDNAITDSLRESERFPISHVMRLNEAASSDDDGFVMTMDEAHYNISERFPELIGFEVVPACCVGTLSFESY